MKSVWLATIFLFIFSIVALQSQAQVLTVSAATGIMQACVNTPSANPDFQQFTVSGTGLTASAVVTAPTGFEVSLSTASGFASSVSLVPAAGTISNTTIYVRLVALPTAGLRTGNVTVSSTGATSKTVAVSGRVYALPAMAAVSNKVYEHGTVVPEIGFTSTSGGSIFNWTNTNTTIGLAASGQGNIPGFTAVNTGLVPVQSTITVTPVSTGFAFIPSGDVIKVVSTESGELVKTIAVGSMPTGVAVSPDGTKAFVSNQNSDNVTVININTLEVVTTIAVGANPTDVVVNPGGTRVYVLNTDASTVSVINTASNAVIATIPVTASLPSRLAIHPVMNRLYVAGVSQISEVNTTTNAQVNTYTIGNALTVITGIAIDPVFGYVHVSDGGVAQNKILILAIDFGISVQGSITTPAGPDGIVISPDGSKAYIAISENDAVAIADLNTRSIITSVAVGQGPEWLALSPDGNYLYAQSNFFTGDISVVNTVTRQLAGELNFISNGGSGNFISAGTGCSGNPITFTITVNPKLPEIIVSQPVGTIVACEGEASADPHVSSITISGVNMKSGITVTAPVNFQVSLTSSSGFGSSLIIPVSGSIVAETTVYVRSSASAPAGELTGSVALTATDAVTQNATVGAWVSALPTVDPVSDYFFKTNVTTDEIVFTGNATAFDWTNSNPSIGLPASGSGSIPGFLGAGGEEAPNEAIITVTPKVMVSGLGCSGSSTSFTITILPQPPAITVIAPRGSIETCEGVASASPEVQMTYVSGTRLTAAVTLTAPAGFEVSTNSLGGFSSNISLSPTGEALDSVMVYIRASALAPAGTITGMLELSSPGAETMFTEVRAIIYPKPSLDIPENVSFVHGEATTPVAFTGSEALNYNWTNSSTAIGLPASGAGGVPSFTATNPGSTPITANVTVKGRTAVYAYLPHNTLPNTLSVINTETGVVEKNIALSTFGTRMAVAPDGKHVYVALLNKTVVVINTATNSIVKTISAGGYVTHILITSDSKKVYAFPTGRNAICIEAETNTVTEAPFGGGSDDLDIVLDETNGLLYYAQYLPSFDFSVPTATMISQVSMETGELIKFKAVTHETLTSAKIRVSPDGQRLYVMSGEKRVTVLNTNLDIVGEVHLDILTNAVMELSRSGEFLFVADAGGNFHRINTATYELDIIDPPGDITIDQFNLLRSDIYRLTSSSFGQLSVLNNTDGSVVRDIPAGEFASAFGPFLTQSSGCTTADQVFSITVYPAGYSLPVVSATAISGEIIACINSPEDANVESVTVTAQHLNDNLIVAAPDGFEISLSSEGSFSGQIVLEPVSGSVNQTVYVRVNTADVAGYITGDLVLTSTGANTIKVNVLASIIPLPAVTGSMLPNGTVGQAYSYMLPQIQHGVTYSAEGLPAGLTMSAGGTISGTPSSAGNAVEFIVLADNGSCQAGAMFTITIVKAAASITIANSSHTYDGSPKSVSVTTNPTGLPVTVTYNGNTTPPSGASTYAVQVTINSPDFQGSKSGSMTISKASASVSIANTEQTYTGASRAVTVNTVPTGLPVIVRYNGSATVPVNAGTYAVLVTINSANYQGTATASLVVAKANASAAISNTEQAYTGELRSVGVTTVPASLPVTVTYNGSAAVPINAGTYPVLVIINSANYQGTATASLVVAKANASVAISNTEQTYTGQSRPVGVTTLPAGLPVTVTYNGSATVPINAGTYPVQVTVNSTNYTGSQTGSLVVSKQPLDITAQNKSRLYGETNPEFTVSYAGFVNGETVAVLDELPTVSTTAISSSDAGQYAITVTGGLDNNYSLVLHPGTLTIGKLDQTIDFTGIDDQTTKSAPFTVTATASTGLPVTFSIVSGPATISGNTVTLTGDPGQVTVRATQAGTVNLNPASADQQFTVTLVLGEDPLYVQSVKIYPNPASHTVAIKIPAELIHAQVELINTQGVVSLSRNFSGKETLELALEGLPQGVYIVRIKNEQALLTRKLVIR